MTPMPRRGLALLLVSLLAIAARYAPPAPGPARLPKDHGSHDDARLEWWYVTGHLFGASGRSGYELTFFRTGATDEPKDARASALAARDLFLAHFARTDVGRSRFAFSERAHRSGVEAAWAREGRLDVANEDWRLVDVGGAFALFAKDGAEELSLLLTPEKPAITHGADGLSHKGAEKDALSKYVSLTRLKTTGWRTKGGVSEPVTGLSWFDHEWGPGGLGSEVAGWDWFALQLADGRDVMIYRLRKADGSPTPWSSGTLVERSGAERTLAAGDATIDVTARWTSAASKATYPARWTLSVPSASLVLDVVPLVADQELVTQKSTGVTYWEGACDVRDEKGASLGSAYVELTGYGSRPLGRLTN
jgi:predicted secreted hydrolase